MHSINGIDWNDIQSDRTTKKSKWMSALNNECISFGVKQLNVSPSYRNLDTEFRTKWEFWGHSFKRQGDWTSWALATFRF